jgi:hypothetical protein
MWWNQNGNLEDIAGLGYVDGQITNFQFQKKQEHF